MNLNIPKSGKEFFIQLYNALFGQTVIDMRLIVVIALALYFGTILIGNLTPYNLFWYSLGVPIGPWLFMDFRDVLVGMECTRRGLNVLAVDPCLPHGAMRPNYPRLWMAFAPLGLGDRDTEWIGVLMAFVFFLCVLWLAGKLNGSGAIIYAFALTSPSVMMAVERGNIDLILFAILCIALILLNKTRLWRGMSYGLVFLTALLKLFPIFAMVILVREKKKVALSTVVGSAVLFILYAVVTYDDLQHIYAQVPRSLNLAFGRSIIPDILQNSGLFTKLFGFHVQPYQATILSIIGMLVMLGIGYVFAWRAFAITVGDKQGIYLDALRVGSIIYIGSFALGNNFDYRFVYLLFAIPQLIVWIESEPPLKTISALTLVSFLLTIWISRWSLTEDAIMVAPKYFIPDEIINWGLLSFFTYILLATMPTWVKQIIFPRNVNQTI